MELCDQITLTFGMMVDSHSLKGDVPVLEIPAYVGSGEGLFLRIGPVTFRPQWSSFACCARSALLWFTFFV